LILASVAIVCSAGMVQAQTRELRPLSSETLDAVLTFLDVDASVPLDAHVVEVGEVLGFRRKKIVFTGGRGNRVPAYLSLPKVHGPARLVLLQHAGASSKESWWVPDGYEYGATLTRRLLENGFAVLALDAQNHGEPSNSIDYVPIRTLYFTNHWWAAFRGMVLETATDYRRALQYVETRPELDLRRIGTVGQSMGGITSVYLAAVEPRVGVVVAGAAALAEPWLYPLSPINLAPALRRTQVLLIAASKDSLIPRANVDALTSALPTENRQLRLLESDHRLPKDYVELAVDWIAQGLQH